MSKGGYSKKGISFFILMITGLLLIGVAAGDTNKQYASSQQCQGCHREIYNEWKESMHANALTDPIFQGALSQQADKTVCISCHAPTTRLTGDFNLTSDISNEAITCDFCHTISGLNASNPIQPFILSPGDTKYGKYSDTVSMTHKTQKTDLLAKSEFCGACHDLAMPNGLVVLATYKEWKNSDYAEKGIECQSCHMPTVKRSIAIGGAQRNDSGAHTWKGGHSVEMLQAAGKFNLDTKTEGSKVHITAVITNDGAGHKLPTGGDSMLILEIAAMDRDGKKLFEETKKFVQVFGDANGSPVPVPDFATQVLSDTRIPPKGISTNEFEFDAVGTEGEIKISGKLLYRHVAEEVAPLPATKVNELSKTVTLSAGNARDTGTKSTPGFEAILALTGVVTLYIIMRKKN